MEFTEAQVKAMMDYLGQKRYVVKPAADVYRDGREKDGNVHGYVVCDTAHQDRVMSGVLALTVAKGWAYSEHESWARRTLRRRNGQLYPEFPDGTPGYEHAERDHP